jgi:hypothetical protein
VYRAVRESRAAPRMGLGSYLPIFPCVAAWDPRATVLQARLVDDPTSRSLFKRSISSPETFNDGPGFRAATEGLHADL